MTETPYTRLPTFVGLSGTVHRGAFRPWGPGAACTSSYMLGQATNGLARDVDCKRCLANHSPITYDVLLPDKRYKEGFRVVHEQVADFAEAQRLADRIIDDLPRNHQLPSIRETPREGEG